MRKFVVRHIFRPLGLGWVGGMMLLGGLCATAHAELPPLRSGHALSDSVISEPTVDTRELMNLEYDDLLEMDFSELMSLAERAGISVDELLESAFARKASIASRQEESLFDSPLATFVITQEDILRSGYTHIPELFHLVPGALVRQKSNGNYDVSFHGMDHIPPENTLVVRENTTILLMIDGRVVYDQFSGGVFWEMLPVSVNDLERIDIVLGAASALYGPNAMTGVINLITRKSSSVASARGMASVGLHAKRDVMLNVALPLGSHWSSRLSAYIQHANRFETDYYSYPLVAKLPLERHVDYRMHSPFLDGWTPRQRELALVRYGGTGNFFYQGPESLSVQLAGGGQYSEVQSTGFDNFVTPFNLRTSSSIFAQTVISYGQIHIQGDVQTSSVNLDARKRTPYNTSFNTITGNASVWGDFDLGYGLSFQPEISIRHTLVCDGVDLKNYDPLQNQGKGGFAPNYMLGPSSLSVASGNFRMEYLPVEALRLVAGLRYDQYIQVRNQALSWQFLAVYSINENQLLRANYSRASRSLFHASLYAYVPPIPIKNTTYSLFDLGGEMGLQPPVLGLDNQYFSLQGNQQLEVPTLDFYEVGYRGKLGVWLQADLSVFYQIMRRFDAPVIEELTVNRFLGATPIVESAPQFRNLDLVAEQFGATLALSSNPLPWLTIRNHVTLQFSHLRDYLVPDGQHFVYDLTGRSGNYAFRRVSKAHTATPAIFGGLNLHMCPFPDKSLSLDIFVNGRTSQVFTYAKLVKDSHPYLQSKIPHTLWADISLSYKILPGLTLFVTGQNLGRVQEQYAFADVVRPTVFGGLRLDF